MTKRQILVVDDEERIREIVQACLEDLGGWSVATAGSGQQGLQVARSQPFDVILLDLSMPDMDGLEFAGQLRQDQDPTVMPIILLTAKAGLREVERWPELGIIGRIAKPFDPITLCNQVAELSTWSEWSNPASLS